MTESVFEEEEKNEKDLLFNIVNKWSHPRRKLKMNNGENIFVSSLPLKVLEYERVEGWTRARNWKVSEWEVCFC